MAKKKSKTKIWLIVGGVILVVLILWLVMGYNKLVGLDNSVTESWANVETQYQRRLDLIPNLVNTVEGAVAFEKETQTEIAALRTGITKAKQALSSAVTPEQQQAALAESDAVVSRFQGLNINVENYPQLKATENFLSLQDELAGTENRVAVARKDFNAAIKNYNNAVRKVPTNLIASVFGFEKKQSFEANEGAATAPKVEF